MLALKKKKFFYIIFIVVCLQYFTIIGQASQENVYLEDVALNDYIFANIKEYIIITDKYKLINANTWNVRYIFIQKVENGKKFSGHVNYSTEGVNFSKLNVVLFNFDENGEIIKDYVVDYYIINDYINISTDFDSGYNAVIIEYDALNRKEPPNNIWNYTSDTTINYYMHLSNQTLFRSFELTVPIPKSHNLDMTPIGYFYTENSPFFIPVSSIKVKDNSFEVKFTIINLYFKDEINKIGYALDFNDNQILKVTFKNRLSYDPITKYDILFAALYSLAGALIMGFILFLLQWRKIDKEKKEEKK